MRVNTSEKELFILYKSKIEGDLKPDHQRSLCRLEFCKGVFERVRGAVNQWWDC